MDYGPVPPPSYPAPPDRQQQQQKADQEPQPQPQQQQPQQQQPQQQQPQQQQPQQQQPQQQLQPPEQPQPQPHITPTPSFPPPLQSSPPPPPQQRFSGDPRLERIPSTSTSTPIFAGAGIETIKSACEISLSGYVELQRQQRRRRQEQQYQSPNQYSTRYDDEDPKAQDRLRTQGSIVVSDLQTLRMEVSTLVRAAEARRWRRWLLGGLVASFIPIIRRIFRRPAPAAAGAHHDRRRARTRESTSTYTTAQATTDTEHAFQRSRSLVSRILDTTTTNGTGSRLASVAFFVLGVLYAFQNEVTLRVGRTVKRRLKRLTNKIERGERDVVDEDLDVLRGWRWRVLLM